MTADKDRIKMVIDGACLDKRWHIMS